MHRQSNAHCFFKGSDIEGIRSLMNVGDYEQARIMAVQLLSEQPKNLLAHIYMAKIFLELNNFGHAIRHANQALLLDEDRVYSHYAYCYKAIAKKALGHYQDALCDINTSINIVQDYPFAYTVRSEILAHLGYNSKATEDKQSALAFAAMKDVSFSSPQPDLPFNSVNLRVNRL